MRCRFVPGRKAQKVAPCPISGEVRRIVLQCGRILGLRLYNVDLVAAPDGPQVVDVNFFPSYQGVPGAAARLADYVARYASGDPTISE